MTKYKCLSSVAGWSALLSIVIHTFKWLYSVFCQYLQLEFQLTVEETERTWRVRRVYYCDIMWLIWWWAGLWSYIPPMTKINQNNLKQSTDIFTWEQHETKSFSNCPSIESVSSSHLSEIKMCDYDLIIEFSCRCDRVHDICNLNHVLIRNVHWLQRAGDEESDKKSEQQEAWCLVSSGAGTRRGGEDNPLPGHGGDHASSAWPQSLVTPGDASCDHLSRHMQHIISPARLCARN